MYCATEIAIEKNVKRNYKLYLGGKSEQMPFYYTRETTNFQRRLLSLESVIQWEVSQAVSSQVHVQGITILMIDNMLKMCKVYSGQVSTQTWC